MTEYTPSEAAAYIFERTGCHMFRSSIQYYVRKGELKSRKVKQHPGSKRATVNKISQSELDRFIRIHKPEARPIETVKPSEQTVEFSEEAVKHQYALLAEAILKGLMSEYASALKHGREGAIRHCKSTIRSPYFVILSMCRADPEDVIKTYRARYGVEEG